MKFNQLNHIHIINLIILIGYCKKEENDVPSKQNLKFKILVT